MGDLSSKKKGIIAGVASVLLVAAVVAVVVVNKYGSSAGRIDGADAETTNKAVKAICNPTQYKETCYKSLADANTTDSKKLISTAIDVAVERVGDVLKQSKLLKEAAEDPMTKQAYEVCDDVLDKAVDDLKRSAEKLNTFDAGRAKEYVADLRTWLSAVVSNQETCVDAFENTTGDTGEKMKNLLKTARELSSNGLAMVTGISDFVKSFQLPSAASAAIAAAAGKRFVAPAPAPSSAPAPAPAPAEHAELVVEAEEVVKNGTLSLKPNITVAKDGSGQFKTINDALASLPEKNNDSFVVIHIKAGVYDEHVEIPKGLNKIVFVGDGPTATRLTGKRSVAGGHQTYYTATLAVSGEDFIAKDIGVENTAGPDGYQALAVRSSGDRAIFFNVHMDGYQDTLCADTHRQYYRNCTISGTIDFVFGNGLALFQDCTFVVRKPSPKQECMVTAQGRFDPKSNSAIIIQNGRFTAEPAMLAVKPPVPSYLGRPWKELSRTIIMQSEIESFISPAGWAPWTGTVGLDTCYYVEYGNRGPGADKSGRVKWKGIHNLTTEEIRSWTGGAVYGGDDAWITESGVPYSPAMMQV